MTLFPCRPKAAGRLAGPAVRLAHSSKKPVLERAEGARHPKFKPSRCSQGHGFGRVAPSLPVDSAPCQP
eukprot:19624-Eustigmatos_ZCMA.PRE.1